MLSSTKDEELELAVCKAICNLALDVQKAFAKEENLLKKIVELTYSENVELKKAAVFALKNLLFKCPKEVRQSVMKELTYERLLDFLDSNSKV